MVDRILHTKQIAAELGCSDKTVLRMYKDNKLPGSYKLGGCGSPVRMRETALRKFIVSKSTTEER